MRLCYVGHLVTLFLFGSKGTGIIITDRLRFNHTESYSLFHRNSTVLAHLPRMLAGLQNGPLKISVNTLSRHEVVCNGALSNPVSSTLLFSISRALVREYPFSWVRKSLRRYYFPHPWPSYSGFN